MKTYYRATHRGDPNASRTHLHGFTLEDANKLVNNLKRDKISYYEFDHETRRIRELFYDGVNTSKCDPEFIQELHFYDNPFRYLCEHYFYNVGEIEEVSEQVVEEELFVDSI